MKRHRKLDVRKLILAAPNGEARSFLGQREDIRSLSEDMPDVSPDLVLVFLGQAELLDSKVISRIESLTCPVLAISDGVDLKSLGKFLDSFDARAEKDLVIGG